MIKKKWFYIFFTFIFCFSATGQNKNDSLSLNFDLNFSKLPIETSKKYVTSNKDTLTIETFKCYISNIKIQYSDNTYFIQKNSFHLLDLDNQNSFQIPINKKSNKLISKVIFDVGIDSLTSTSGALQGDLDVTKGMYWAWQSGYINMKIEGKSLSCKTRNNKFQFHIGGYLAPNYALRTIEIPINKTLNPTEITITIDMAKFFSEINLAAENEVMIPGKKAMQLADFSVKMFQLE